MTQGVSGLVSIRQARQGSVVLLAEPLQFSRQVIGGLTNLGPLPDPPLIEPRKVGPQLSAPNDRIQKVVLACQKTRRAGWALSDVPRASTGPRPVVDEAYRDVSLLGRLDDQKPVSPTPHSLPNHRKCILERRLQIGVGRTARVDKDPKRFGRAAGRLVLTRRGPVAQGHHEKRQHQRPGSGRTVPDHRGISPRSRLAFAWAFTRLRAP